MTDIRVRSPREGLISAEISPWGRVRDQREIAAIAIDALFALGEDLFEPLSVEGIFPCCHREYLGPLQSEPYQVSAYRQLQVASPPKGVRIGSWWRSTRVESTERLDRQTILEWIDTVLTEHECPDPADEPGWTLLIVDSFRVRLPDATAQTVVGDALAVESDIGTLSFPVESSAGGHWVAGPDIRYAEDAPFRAWIDHEMGTLTFNFYIFWSLWMDGAGFPVIEAAIRRLADLGWTVKTYRLGPA
ncbi:hypothetical protein [Nocardia paucivorans]|uniref:hypothetical protein n=1 Tax=Nocardia paucivorans TaxID=114259 RepID=UPI000317C04A|nr:hypothetical protein [Nocardia paucivorans]